MPEPDERLPILLDAIKELRAMVDRCPTCSVDGVALGSVKDAAGNWIACPNCTKAMMICDRWDDVTT